MKSFLTSAIAWARKYLLAPLPALLLIAGAIVLVMMGVKNIKIGGLLAKLMGKPEGARAVDVANSLPEHRVDSNGNVLAAGTPDAQGTTQAVVVPIETGGLFSDPGTVKITPPGESAAVVVHLPDGVKDSDVDKVIIIKPQVYAVTVKDSSGIPAKRVDDLLAKYGS